LGQQKAFERVVFKPESPKMVKNRALDIWPYQVRAFNLDNIERRIKKFFGRTGFGKNSNISKLIINSTGLFHFSR
jgi:hypothetical protein